MVSGKIVRLGVIVIVFMAICKNSVALNLNERFHFITTLVAVTIPDGQRYTQAKGTAFFYQRFAQPKKQEPHWRAIQKIWLVTNRHVILPKVGKSEVFPLSFAFHMRRIENNALRWEPIVIQRDDLLKRARFHQNPEVDVAVIEVQDILMEKARGKEKYAQWYGVSKENFSGENNIEVEASDDVIVIGYPRAFYDQTNLYPIVKSGIIASRWGANFNGKPYFLIDAKLFPGSSGSIVLSKPTDLVTKNQYLRQK